MNTPSEVSTITVRYEEAGVLHPDFPITLGIYDMNLEWVPVFWEDETDVSLGGAKRSNIRGWDFKLTLNYEASLEPDKIEKIFDNLLGLIEPDADFYVSIDGTDYVKLLPLSDTMYRIEFKQQVRTGGSDAIIPSLSFTSDTLFAQVGDTFQPLS